MGQQKPREKPNKPKKTKKPILNGLTQDSSHRIVFFCFFGVPRVFGQLGLGQQKPREKPNKPKKTKKTILNGLTQDSSHRIGFFAFFGFPRVFGQLGLGQQKPREKPNKPKKNNPEWTYPRFFSQDWFFWFFLVFFVFFEFLDNWAWESKKTSRNTKKNKKNKKQKNNFTWTYPRFFSQDWFFWFFWFSLSFWTFGKLRMEKKGKNKTCKNPTLPAWVSEKKSRS